jgi:tRNA A37 threonylcarbamoyladenosine biosynthesis protein TsaE
MLLDAIKLDKGNLCAAFTLSSADETKSLGLRFAGVLLENPHSCVGLIAPTSTGKTTFVSGIYQGLGLTYGTIDNMMVGVNGINPVHTDKGLLVRHYDLAVNPEDEDHLSIPSHWAMLDNRAAEKPALHLVEHATKCFGETFDFVFKLAGHGSMQRSAEFYCADNYTGTNAVQEFLADSQAMYLDRGAA